MNREWSLRLAGITSVLIVVSCQNQPVAPEIAVDIQFEVVSADECPDDAPDCIPATQEQLDELREVVDAQMNPEGGVWCETAYNNLIDALDMGAVDTFQDFTRNGWHVLGSYNTGNGRVSFNRSFFGGGSCNTGWCDITNFGKTASHEGGHSVNPSASEQSVKDYFESECVWN